MYIMQHSASGVESSIIMHNMQHSASGVESSICSTVQVQASCIYTMYHTAVRIIKGPTQKHTLWCINIVPNKTLLADHTKPISRQEFNGSAFRFFSARNNKILPNVV